MLTVGSLRPVWREGGTRDSALCVSWAVLVAGALRKEVTRRKISENTKMLIL